MVFCFVQNFFFGQLINILTLVVRILLFFVAQSANFFPLNNKIIQLSRLPFLIIFCQQEMN
jgi:hypothetical protein